MIALTREVSAAIGRCELTHLGREPIDVERARGQHRAYEQALASLGCEIRRVSPADDLPDSVFIEDTAIVLPEVAVVARPGAASRRPEVAAVVELLGGWRPLVRIDAPGTLDGGDVLVLDRSVFVGRSSRTNDAAIAQLGAVLGPYGYRVTTVATPACLHLKSAVTSLTPQAVLLNPAWIAPAVFAGYECVEVDGAEPAAANVVSVGGRLLCAAAYPRTGDRLERRGFGVVRVDVSELAKAEGALTCCSLLVS